MKKAGFVAATVCLLWSSSVLAGLSGKGTAGEPYLIESLADFDEFAGDPNYWAEGVHAKLMCDIDLAGKVYVRAVIAPDKNNIEYDFQGAKFSGVFDGAGHVISNINVEGDNHLGVFGKTSGASEIKNLGVEDINIIGDDWLGGLVGFNHEGTITNCYCTGSVTGDGHNLGGLVGLNGYGTITNCYCTGSVTGSDGSRVLGGLVGFNAEGTITNCYCTGSVMGGYKSYKLGGLVGKNDCGTITSCFWDTQTSGMSSSEGGRAVTTAQMKTAATFSGWNDGSWIIDEGVDYPRLSWEGTEGNFITTDYPARTYNGSGTREDPFTLGTADDVVCMAQRVPDWDKHFILATDVDMSTVTDYFPPSEFTGVFDGAGYIIEKLTIDSAIIHNRSHIGLFGKIAAGSEVKNLGIEDINVIGIEYSHLLGGLAGYNYEGTITNCYCTGSVTGDGHNLGVLVGKNLHGTITNCYSRGSVTGGSGSSYSAFIGGLVGLNYYGTITNCCSTGSVTGGYHSNYVGGLVGRTCHGTITNCYSIGSVMGGDGSDALGGFVGCNKEYSTITNCFWDTETSEMIIGVGDGDPNGVTGKTTAEMQDIDTFLNVGWDFVTEMKNGTSQFWYMPNNNYPTLSIFSDHEPPLLTGIGTHDDPYLIHDGNELGAIYRYDLSASYRLANNIDLSGIKWSVAPIQVLSGSFDGAGFIVSNLTIEGGDYLGLFGITAAESEINNLGVEDVNIMGEYHSYYLGGLVGENNGSVSRCYSTGSVKGGDRSWRVGGLVGKNYGTITNCYSTSCVSGGVGADCLGGIGGLGGDNFGTITNCYSTGRVTGDDPRYLGGLVGEYWRGKITNCFWDMETSGLTESSGGTGLMSEQMQNVDTYLSAGWDFVGEVVNGEEDIWAMPLGWYPVLAWEYGGERGGDVTGDGFVDMGDVILLAEQWLGTGGEPSGDVAPEGGDGVVNFVDFAVVGGDLFGR